MDGLKRVVVAGGSGFLGAAILAEFREAGYETVALSRSPGAVPHANRVVYWDGASPGDWSRELNGAAAVLNLAGTPLTCRWTPENRQKILDSRVKSTEAIGEAVRGCESPPQAWVNTSGVSYYGDTRGKSVDERAPVGRTFLADVAKRWEGALFRGETPQTRRVAIRVAPVFGRGGGIHEALRKLVHFRLGGRVGNGRQAMSWIHVEDLARLYRFCAEHPLEGPVNGCAPEAVTNDRMMATLRQEERVGMGLPAPAVAVGLAHRVTGIPTHLALEDLRAVPKAALEAGFTFKFETFEAAAKDLSG